MSKVVAFYPGPDGLISKTIFEHESSIVCERVNRGLRKSLWRSLDNGDSRSVLYFAYDNLGYNTHTFISVCFLNQDFCQ